MSGEPPQPVLTIDEVADWLGMHRNSVHRAARQGRHPARRVGKEWRFLAEAVAARWTPGRRLRGPAEPALSGPAFPESPVELSALEAAEFLRVEPNTIYHEAAADASGFVWPGRDGGPMSPSSVTHLVAKVGKRAGLVDTKGHHVAHGHGLRHSAGSIALSEGVPLTVVAATLRHSRPSFTAQRYSHLLSDGELDRFASAHSTRTVRDTVRGNGQNSENPTK